MPEDHVFLCLPEAAALLRIGERTAYTLARTGRLPAIKVGGQWRVHRPTLMKWATSGGPSPVVPSCLSQNHEEQQP